MGTVRRYDRGTLQEPKRLASGGLRLDGYASRVGVQAYSAGNGKTRLELRLPEEVFHRDSLDSFEGAWMTDGHPADFVTPETARDLSRGLVKDAGRPDGEMVAMSSVIDDKRMLKKLDEIKAAGRSAELSVGYHVDLDETPGNHPVYGKYDAIQRNIRVNHVAILDTRTGANARAGRGATLRLDEAEAVLDDGGAQRHNPHAMRSSTMTPEEIEALKKALATQTKRADTEAKRADDERKRADGAEGLVNGLKDENTKLRAARVDEAEVAGLKAAVADLTTKLETEKKTRLDETAPKVIQEHVQTRLAVVKAALEVDPELRWDDLSNRDIQVKTIAKINGESMPTTRSDAYVDGVFNALIEGRRAWSSKLPQGAGSSASVTVHVDRTDRRDDDKGGDKKLPSFADLGHQPLPNSREARAARR